MIKHEIQSQPRVATGRKVKNLRSKGITPANVFGHKIKSAVIQLDTKEFLKIYKEIGESTLAYLKVEGEKETRPVFVSDLFNDSVSGNLMHVTFHQVDLKEKVTAPVPIELIGEPLAEKEKLGIMVQQIDEVEIEALPTDMPEHIQVDVVGLAQVGAHITVADLKLDASKLTVKTDPESIVVQIEALAKEEVAPVVATPEVEGAVPTEATPTEGATPAAAAKPASSAKPAQAEKPEK